MDNFSRFGHVVGDYGGLVAGDFVQFAYSYGFQEINRENFPANQYYVLQRSSGKCQCALCGHG